MHINTAIKNYSMYVCARFHEIHAKGLQDIKEYAYKHSH